MFVGETLNKIKISVDNYNGEKLYCPVCNTELVFKNGEINAKHFAHKTLVNCDTWSEMSLWHKEWQDRFDVEYREVPIGEHRADILKDGIVIEFQKSHLSIMDMNERIDYYSKDNDLIFVFDLRDKNIIFHGIDEDGDMAYSWRTPSKTIIDPYYKDYNLLFQINDFELIWIRKQVDGLKHFKAYRKLSIDNFLMYFKDLNLFKNKLENKRLNIEHRKAREKMKYHILELQNSIMNEHKAKQSIYIEETKKQLEIELEDFKKAKAIELDELKKIKCEEIKQGMYSEWEKEFELDKENIVKELKEKAIEEMKSNIYSQISAKDTIEAELDKIAIVRDLTILSKRKHDEDVYKYLVDVFKTKDYEWVIERIVKQFQLEFK